MFLVLCYNSDMPEILKSKLLSAFPEIEHGTYRGTYGPYFNRNVKLNRMFIDEKALFKSMNLPEGHSLVVSEQEHTDNIFIVREDPKGILKVSNNDAVITNQKNVHLLTYTADCLPILIYDPVKKVIAAIHSGWKGVMNQIAIKTIFNMENEFGSDRKDVVVYIGPSIGSCCYAAKTPERFEKFKKYKNGGEEKDGMYYINLWGAIEEDLLEFGIKKENIEISEICTMCNSDKFASHYFEGDKRITTNMTTIAMI